jgi:UDP-2,4-diacetamido-2,4,6-trideoxy-beta-L-altropyranose hydrolase
VGDSLLLIRADANAVIGVGHMMRCLGLAQHWQAEGGRVIFILAQPNPTLEKRLQLEKFEIQVLNTSPGELEDAERTAQCVQATGAKILLVDGYHFKQNWFMVVRKEKVKIALWTDYCQDSFLPVNLILNQNPHAQVAELQAKAPGSKVLAGLDYLVLRKEFLNRPELRHGRTQGVKKILITLGGGDSANDSGKIIEALKSTPYSLPLISLVVGHNNPRFEELTSAAKDLATVTLERAKDDFAAYSQEFDLAISAAGATLWELGYLGLPSLAYIVAENQVPLAQSIQTLGMGVNMGWNHDFQKDLFTQTLQSFLSDPLRLEAMSKNALKTIDGKGGVRVTAALKNLIN